MSQPDLPQPDADPDRPPVSRIGPARCVSLLLGASMAMVIAGLASRFRVVFTESASSDAYVISAVTGVALVTLALGVRLPQRFAVWVCAAAWRRFVSRGSPLQMSDVLPSPGAADRPLYWMVLSVIALAAGVATALLPTGLRFAVAAYDWMLAHFVWSIGPLAVLQAAIVFLTAVVPLAILGLAVSCVHQLSCPYGRWETRATAWLLIGAAGGTLMSGWITGEPGRGDLILIVAALPVLLISLVSATSSASRAGASPQAVGVESMPLPIWSDRWPTLLRAGIVSVAGGGACAITVWTEFLHEVGSPVTVFLPAMLLATGLGVLAGCQTKRSGLRSIGGFGVACAAAGVIVAVSTIGAADTASAGPAGVAVLACASLFAIGFATAYGRQALLSRVASRSFAGAVILSRMLVCAALTIWAGVPLAERLAGRPGTLVALALSLLVLGGALIIREPSYSPRTRRVRLCAVFGSIGVMIVLSLYPTHLRQWRPVSRRAPSAPVSPVKPRGVETEYSPRHNVADP
ncbi:MAG: hypothetical protein WBE26_13590 [Phycisphaerae bacterium]